MPLLQHGLPIETGHARRALNEYTRITAAGIGFCLRNISTVINLEGARRMKTMPCFSIYNDGSQEQGLVWHTQNIC
jgi:hypothetical protein